MFLWLNILFLFVANGTANDPRWTDEEAKKRAEEIFTPEELKQLDIYRSKYYIIFTDSGAGQNFAKILDNQVYEGFREYFPFKDAEEQKLMPIYLFKTKEGYVSFCERVPKWNKQQAEQSAGHAWKDYYATSYTSPRDSVHFHEGAHQIMMNRFRLFGGGSWYQEGIAEYYQDKIEKLNRASETKAAIKSGETLSFPELFTTKSLLFSQGKKSVKGYGGSSGRYGQAASVIQFLKEGPHKDKFQTFFVKMGKVQRSDLKEIEKVIQSIYSLSIAELEAQWKDYFL